MNPKLASLFSRRSIRAFTSEKIPAETITDLLTAAMAAPSACAKDPWDFIVVTDKKRLTEITAALPNGPFLSSAACGIVVTGNISKAHRGELSYLIQDCAAAIQNLLLAADMLGLGACWLGVHPRQERMDFLQNYFSLPQDILPIAVIALGVPAEKKPPATRFQQSKVHVENFRR